MPGAKKVYRLFKVATVCKHSSDMAMRYALSSLTGKRGVEEQSSAKGDRRVEHNVHQLVDWRRRRVTALGKAGWGRGRGRYWPYAVNCPPVGVVTQPRGARTCQRVRFCPFCWARQYVRDAYLQLEYAYYGANRVYRLDSRTGKREKIPPRNLELSEVRRWWQLPQHTWSINDVFRKIQKERSRFLQEYYTQQRGSMILYSVEPPSKKDEGPPCWQVCQRSLVLVEPDGLAPVWSSGGEREQWECRRHEDVNRWVLSAAVGRVGLYPRRLMTAPVEDVVPILDYRPPTHRNVRLCSYSGLLRNKEQREFEATLEAL